jgi:flagellar motor switch protein FliG
VLRELSPNAMRGLTQAATDLAVAPLDIVETSTRAFISEMNSFGNDPLTRGLAFRSIMESALGADAVRALTPGPLGSDAVQTLVDAEADDIALLLRKEQSATVALVLTMLPVDKAAAVLSRLPAATRTPLLRTLFSVVTVSPDVVNDVVRGLAEQLQRFVQGGKNKKMHGDMTAISILRSMPPTDQATAMEEIEEVDPPLAERIRGKLMSFDELMAMGNKSIQVLLQSCETKTLALALKGVSAAMVDMILSNMSSRAATNFREEMESLGRVRLSHVEAAQASIMKVALKLVEEDRIQIAGQSEKML